MGWIELAPERLPPTAPPLQKTLEMLLPEVQLRECSATIRDEAAGTRLGVEIIDLIAATLVSRFCGRTVPQRTCARDTCPMTSRAASLLVSFTILQTRQGADVSLVIIKAGRALAVSSVCGNGTLAIAPH